MSAPYTPATVTVCSAAITVTSDLDSGAGTLRQALVDICANGTITFADDYTITLSSTLNVGKNVTIDGGNHAVVLDGGHGCGLGVQILYATASVTLTNLTLQNGANVFGGGVYNAGGTMTIANSHTDRRSNGVCVFVLWQHDRRGRRQHDLPGGAGRNCARFSQRHVVAGQRSGKPKPLHLRHWGRGQLPGSVRLGGI